jgi:aryl-alcohol dehydrogenase-like predicted oxidoreductase
MVFENLYFHKLVLGTVQFGLNYGINNLSGKPSQKDVFEILDTALEHKIDSLDTADAYGNAIQQICLYHQITKHSFKILSKFKNVTKGQLFELSQKSLKNLDIPNFEVYSYHSFNDYLSNPYLMDELQSLKLKGLIKKIGISVYTNSELHSATLDKNIDVIQLPYNILDNQNIRGAYINHGKLNNKEIHVRSVFLQGLLLMDEDSIPKNLTQLRPYIKEIKSYCTKESLNIQSLALSYAVCNMNIDNVIIGVDNKKQLLMNIATIINMKSAFEFIDAHINIKETELLNPVNWK